MKDWLKSPEPEAMMAPRVLGGIEDFDEGLFEALPPPGKSLEQNDNQLPPAPVQLPLLKDICRRSTHLFLSLACLLSPLRAKR